MLLVAPAPAARTSVEEGFLNGDVEPSHASCLGDVVVLVVCLLALLCGFVVAFVPIVPPPPPPPPPPPVAPPHLLPLYMSLSQWLALLKR